jgi:NADH:ubiquinone oxidoreductase subunit C
MSEGPAQSAAVESEGPLRSPVVERLLAVFPDAESGVSADDIPYLRVPAGEVARAAALLKQELGYGRFIDLTAVDSLEREDRFELQYLLFSMDAQAWFRLKARTAEAVPSIVAQFAGANWYEREVWDLFGVRFEGHPDLQRIMLPDDWQGHPLRRDVETLVEPVDFTVTREIYGT